MQIPIANCRNCQDKVPVVLDEVFVEEYGFKVVVTYCPQCESILNDEANLKVEWYDLDDLPDDFNWQVQEIDSATTAAT